MDKETIGYLTIGGVAGLWAAFLYLIYELAKIKKDGAITDITYLPNINSLTTSLIYT